jgi:hypothetical protein
MLAYQSSFLGNPSEKNSNGILKATMHRIFIVIEFPKTIKLIFRSDNYRKMW